MKGNGAVNFCWNDSTWFHKTVALLHVVQCDDLSMDSATVRLKSRFGAVGSALLGTGRFWVSRFHVRPVVIRSCNMSTLEFWVCLSFVARATRARPSPPIAMQCWLPLCVATLAFQFCEGSQWIRRISMTPGSKVTVRVNPISLFRKISKCASMSLNASHTLALLSFAVVFSCYYHGRRRQWTAMDLTEARTCKTALAMIAASKECCLGIPGIPDQSPSAFVLVGTTLSPTFQGPAWTKRFPWLTKRSGLGANSHHLGSPWVGGIEFCLNFRFQNRFWIAWITLNQLNGDMLFDPEPGKAIGACNGWFPTLRCQVATPKSFAKGRGYVASKQDGWGEDALSGGSIASGHVYHGHSCLANISW